MEDVLKKLTVQKDNGKHISYLQGIWSQNKARGLTAQANFITEFDTGTFTKHKGKFFHGCWLLSPKSIDYYKSRFCIFVHDSLLKPLPDETDPLSLLTDEGRPFYAVSEFMKKAGIGVAYAVASDEDGVMDFDSILKRDYSSLTWNIFLYEGESLVKKNTAQFFDQWMGNKGRASYRKDTWTDMSVKKAFQKMEIIQLEGLVLNELFYTGYLKSVLKKPLNDPYDVDGFIISLSQRHILPVEMKEKFPVIGQRESFFGIDAGRIMMLLRLCIPNDSNALYIVREVKENGREFVAWKYITLAKMIMSSAWNLQAGGTGMGGQNTQTLKIPYSEFETLTPSTFDEENLQIISDLPKGVKELAEEYGTALEKKFFLS